MTEPKIKHVPKRFRLARAILSSVAILCAIYYLTATAVPALQRHSGDGGKLARIDPVFWTVLEWYRWPMDQLSQLPIFRGACEFGAAVWWRILDPPDTTP